jgi:hypothetical protein
MKPIIREKIPFPGAPAAGEIKPVVWVEFF